jgi:hypothetical protein
MNISNSWSNIVFIMNFLSKLKKKNDPDFPVDSPAFLALLKLGVGFRDL